MGGLHSRLSAAVGELRELRTRLRAMEFRSIYNEGIYAVFFRGHFHKAVRIFRIILPGKISKKREARWEYR